MAYWHRTGQHTFRPTEHVGGSWDLTTQHIAPALGVMAHEIELDLVARRDDRLVISRLSYDILGTVPMEAIEVAVEVLRPGRTIELVQATARHGGRTIVILRAWLVQPFDTAAHAGTGCPAIPSPDDTPAWPMSDLWPGGFIASAQVRRTDHGPGRSTCWVRTDHALVADEEVSRLAAQHASREELERAALHDQVDLVAQHAKARRDLPRGAVVVVPGGVLAAPGVEAPVGEGDRSVGAAAAHEQGPVVAEPHIVERDAVEVDVGETTSGP